jgi:DNA-directed RNA polymerase specialized sigma24 family protein
MHGNELESSDASGGSGLYLRVREYLASPELRARFIEEIVEHPFSQLKLHYACCAVLRSWPNCYRRLVQDDIRQEAICVTIQHLGTCKTPFVDRGRQQFEGWLWTLWYNACRQAWRKYRRSLLREQKRADLSEVCVVCADNLEDWTLVLQLIQTIDDMQLKVVMLDWAAGFSVDETCELRALSRSAVYRRRQRGLTFLRSVLDTKE